ncbi:nitrate- and nitrite sensing domain-containing protein [Micromonospora sp. WMMD987]|uniref:nitrate- and nitrite sensing domain-containing protein n=1 Tax=Micromonospora sp. WMMD987 TaxID=3016089 RepID=UPI00249B0068|nr:nitrate- and nitrite sensing domain-containing protein [Micromonospora sp. WMMD987]WFE93827.1 nitrate- and nitrite sensing domain-containing protein [Micromonospora sp. WMMD987]
MGSGSTRLRTKIVALLTSLVALWSFAAWVTVRDGFNLLWVQTLNSRVADPGESLLTALQDERRLANAYLGERGQRQLDALTTQWQRTDQVADDFGTSVGSWQAELATGEDTRRRVDEVLTGLSGLTGVRESVRDAGVNRAEASDAYTAILAAVLRMYGSLGQLDDARIAAESETLVDLYQVRELISQQDALITGVLAAGRMTGDEYARFAQLVGAQRYQTAEAAAELSPADRVRYDQLAGSDAVARFRVLEDRVIQQSRSGTALPTTTEEWQSTVGPAMQAQVDFAVTVGDALIDRATPVAVGVIVRLVLAAGLGLIAVIASIVVSISTARHLVRQLARLRDAALRLAHERLPGVVDRLGRGEDVDVAREAPPLDFGDDEIGQLGRAFNAVQETAVRTAVEQAELRRNVRAVFLSLARRTQALVHRQLTLLDAMERREHDAEELEDLFRVDHLATRMRRNAENLIVLSGATPGRAWRRNVPMVDVVRGAVAEVEDYTRVDVLPLGPVALAGRAVGDVIHLLAELIENGLSFSPPQTTVEVRGRLVTAGYVIEIEDRGLGLTGEELVAANRRIVDRSELNLADAARLGLYVVSRLTERHGVRVQLKESAYGGTTAVVLIPAELVVPADPSPSGALPVVTGRPAVPEPPPAAPDPVSAPAAPPVAPAAAPPSGVLSPAGLPTRSRKRRVSQDALHAPTVPTGLPVTRPRPHAPDGPVTDPPPPTDDGAPTRDGAAPGPSTDGGAASGPSTDGGAASGPSTDGGAAPGQPVDGPDADATVPLPNRSAGPVPADQTTPEGQTVDDGDRPPSPTVEGSVTDAGLPVRVRQANLAPELRTLPTSGEAGAGGAVRRAPEQVRQMMSAYQSGTRRGRTDAARLLEGSRAGDRSDDGDDPTT